MHRYEVRRCDVHRCDVHRCDVHRCKAQVQLQLNLILDKEISKERRLSTFRFQHFGDLQLMFCDPEGLFQIVFVGSVPHAVHVNQVWSQCMNDSQKSHPISPA